MKVQKKAQQHNVVLNQYYYTFFDIKDMIEKKEICFLDENLNEKYNLKDYILNHHNESLIIFLDDGDEIKIVLDEYGYYKPVLIKNGKKYYINL